MESLSFNSLPILQPAYDYIFQQDAKLKNLPIHLFVTNQYDENFKNNDTIYFGRIIKKIILESGNYKTNKVEIHEIKDYPNLYDYMFQFYKNEIKKIKDGYKKINNLDVLVTGGTPACNMALLFHSITFFGNSVRSLYVSENKGRKVEHLFSVKQLNEEFQKQNIKSYLKSYDYSAILAIGLESKNEKLRLLSQSAMYRLSFNFEESRELIRELHVNFLDMNDLKSIEVHLTKLSNEDFYSLIKELLLNIEVKYKTGQYVDALGRLFRLEEAILGWPIEKNLGINVSNDTDDFAEFSDGIDKNESLKKHLDSKKIEYKQPNRRNMREIVCFISKNNDFVEHI